MTSDPLQSTGAMESTVLRKQEDGSLSPDPSPFSPFSQAVVMFPHFSLPSQSLISLTTSSQRMAQCNTRMGSWSPSRYVHILLAPSLSCSVHRGEQHLPYPGRWAASSLQLLPLPGGLHGKSSIVTCPSLSAGHSGPLGGGAAAGSDQLLSQLHGTAEVAQETVMAQT